MFFFLVLYTFFFHLESVSSIYRYLFQKWCALLYEFQNTWLYSTERMHNKILLLIVYWSLTFFSKAILNQYFIKICGFFFVEWASKCYGSEIFKSGNKVCMSWLISDTWKSHVLFNVNNMMKPLDWTLMESFSGLAGLIWRRDVIGSARHTEMCDQISRPDIDEMWIWGHSNLTWNYLILV